MRKLTKLLSALIVLVLATAFIGCGNPSSSSGGGNSNSPTYTLTTGRPYFCSDDDDGYIFHDDKSVSWFQGSSTPEILDGQKWRVSGYTVETYDENNSGHVFNTFTANPDFTQLTMISYNSIVYTLQ